jgi:hypothetical protein
MEKAINLLKSAEIEYITPFMKLWLSFNSWYKEELENPMIRDFDAIENIKNGGKIKNKFLSFLGSDNYKIFNEELFNLFFNLQSFDVKNRQGEIIFDYYSQNPQIIYIRSFERSNLPSASLIKIFEDKLQILNTSKDEFYKVYISLIYEIRNTLIHGEGDIQNNFFLKLIKSAYITLFCIMNEILRRGAEI